MKILLLTHLFPNSQDVTWGIYNLSRAKAMRFLGCEVKVIAPIGMTPPEKLFFGLHFSQMREYMKERTRLPLHDTIEGFEVFYPRWYWLPKKLFWSYEAGLLHLFAGKLIKKIILDFAPDVILASWLHPYGTYAKYLKGYVDVPVFCYAEGSDVMVMPDEYRGWNAIERTINQYVDKVILISKAMQKNVREKRNIQSQLLVVDGFDEELFKFTSFPPKESQASLLSVGDTLPVKGHDLLIRALPLVRGNVRLTIVGKNVTNEQLLKLAIKEDVHERVSFVDSVPHQRVKEFIDRADIVCMPSRSDAQPAAAVESLACGRPVVGTRVGGLTDIILDGFNGYLAEPESPESLADCIEKAMSTRWDYRAISSWALQNYGWRKSVKELLGYIQAEIDASNVGPDGGKGFFLRTSGDLTVQNKEHR
jgi:glycosyltransferase involved in cell wall biosynthesis